jgi:PilZ domain
MIGKNHSPSLEVISRDSVPPYDERRSFPRLSLAHELFRLKKNERVFSVADLSLGGMAIWLLDPEDLQYFLIGLSVEGILSLRRQKYEVRARVRNLRVDRVGLEFEGLSVSVSEVIGHFLEPQILGQELRPIPAPSLSSLWYHGPCADLLLYRAMDGKYHKWVLSLLGNWVQWDDQEGLVTGQTQDSHQKAEVHGIVRLETLLVKRDLEPDPEKLRIAKTLILSSNLPQDLKTWCIRQFEREKAKNGS